MMKKLLIGLLAGLLWTTGAHAATAGPAWDKFPKERVTDLAALQNGAKLFTNYCLNCHAAAFMRYNRLRDIGLSDTQIQQNLLFASPKVGDLMKVAMDPREAKEWFGAAPPDLTVIARSRADAAKGSGSDYLYTFLRSFYRDDTKATGWNNTAFPSVAMPHVLWELQGQQRALYEERKDAHDATKVEHAFKGFEMIRPGAMNPQQYNEAVADLVAYLTWMGEPMAKERVRLGVWVLLFLVGFTAIMWRLNKAFWKDVR